MPVRMAEVPLRPDEIAQALFQHLGLGEAAVFLALPDLRAVAGDDEHPAGARDEGDRADFLGEGGQQFLRQPGGAEHPVALAAVGDGDGGLFGHGVSMR